MFPCHLPYAIDRNGDPVLPIAAKRLKRSSLEYGYQCPECRQPVQRFAEPQGKQVPHFRHVYRHASTLSCCFLGGGGESALHRRACHDVKARLLAVYAAGYEDQSIRIEATCSVHGITHSVAWRPSSRDIRINRALPDSSANSSAAASMYRPDVVIYHDDGRVDLIIEVRHRHEISPEKVDFYARRGFDWIEIVADDVQQSCDRLVARQHSFAMPCCGAAPGTMDGIAFPLPQHSIPESLDPAGILAVGRPPWGTVLAWDGRSWRELTTDGRVTVCPVR